jgi:type I restriction enzyme, S subunit
MTPHDLIAAFEALAEAPEGVARLRELILQLAVRGRLVPQDPKDEPAGVMLKRVAADQARRLKAANNRKACVQPPAPEAGVPFAIPDGWVWATLSSVAAYNGRGNADPNTISPDSWLLDLGDIEKDTSRILTRATFRERMSRSNKSTFKQGDVLYGKLRPYLNKVVVADADGYCTTEIVPIVPGGGILAEYLRLSLKRPDFLALVNRLAYGVKMPRLGTEDAESSLHPIPPLAEQHRIVARVDELMSLLDRLEAARTKRDTTRAAVRDSALDALRQADTPEEVDVAWHRFAQRMDDLVCNPADIAPLRQTVLQLAVRGRLVRQDPKDEPASILLQRIAAEKARLAKAGQLRKQDPPLPVESSRVPFSLPEGWEWCRLGQLYYSGPTSYGEDPRPDWPTAKVVKVGNVSPAGAWQGTLVQRSYPSDEIDALLVRAGDLLVVKSSGSAENVHSGKTAMCTEAHAGLLVGSNFVIRLCPVHALLPAKFFWLLLNSPYSRAWVADTVRTFTYPNLKWSDYQLLQTPLPPLAEQHRIVARVDELMGLLDRLEARLTAARTAHSAFAAAAVHHLDA